MNMLKEHIVKKQLLIYCLITILAILLSCSSGGSTESAPVNYNNIANTSAAKDFADFQWTFNAVVTESDDLTIKIGATFNDYWKVQQNGNQVIFTSSDGSSISGTVVNSVLTVNNECFEYDVQSVKKGKYTETFTADIKSSIDLITGTSLSCYYDKDGVLKTSVKSKIEIKKRG